MVSVVLFVKTSLASILAVASFAPWDFSLVDAQYESVESGFPYVVVCL